MTRLRPWAHKIRRWAASGRPVFVYFNNDWEQHALRDARTLARLSGVPLEKSQAGALPLLGR